MRRLPLFLALSGFLLIGSGLALGAFYRVIAAPGVAPLPLSVASLPLTTSLTGAEASADIAYLHQQQFPLSGAAVGTYGDNTSGATLWVSESPVALLAARMERTMEQAVAKNTSPFVPMETRRVNGRSIQVLSGMGQDHFYFRSGKRIVWLAVDHALAEDALAVVLAFYP